MKISIKDICNLFNEALKLDSECVSDLIGLRAPCNNSKLRDHENIIVREHTISHSLASKLKSPKKYSLGFIGLLNALFDTEVIAWVVEEGKILEFKPIAKSGIKKLNE